MKINECVVTGSFERYDGCSHKEELGLIRERDLQIWVNGMPTGVVSCTPADQDILAIGWLFTEEWIESMEDIKELVLEEANDRVMVMLNDGPLELETLFGSSPQTGSPQTGSPQTGSEENGIMSSVRTSELDMIFKLREAFLKEPPLREQTGAAHSCMIARRAQTPAPEMEVLYRSEDAGRHSALDKAIGWALLKDIDLSECILITSGRISTRMAGKAVRAGAWALAGKGAVTAEAVEIAREHGMILLGYLDSGSTVCFTGIE